MLSGIFFGLLAYIVWSISRYLIDISTTFFSISGVAVIVFSLLALWQLRVFKGYNQVINS